MIHSSWNIVSDVAMATANLKAQYPPLTEDEIHTWTVGEALDASGRVVLSDSTMTYGELVESVQDQFISVFESRWGRGASEYVPLWKKTVEADLKAVRAEEIVEGQLRERFSNFLKYIDAYVALESGSAANFVALESKLQSMFDGAQEITSSGGGGSKEVVEEEEAASSVDLDSSVSSTETLEANTLVSPTQERAAERAAEIIGRYNEEIECIYGAVQEQARELVLSFPVLGKLQERRRSREQTLQKLRIFANDKRNALVASFDTDERVFIQTKGKIKAWKKRVEKMLDAAILTKDATALQLYVASFETIPKEFLDEIKRCVKCIAEKVAFSCCDLSHSRLEGGETFQQRADYLVFGALEDWVRAQYSGVSAVLVRSTTVLPFLHKYIDPYFNRLIDVTRWRHLGTSQHMFFKQVLFEEIKILEVIPGKKLLRLSEVIKLRESFNEKEESFLKCRGVWSFVDVIDHFFVELKEGMFKAAALHISRGPSESLERYHKRLGKRMRSLTESLKRTLHDAVDRDSQDSDPAPVVSASKMALEQPYYRMMMEVCRDLQGQITGLSETRLVFSEQDLERIKVGIERYYQLNIQDGEEEADKQVRAYIKREIQFAIRSVFSIDEESIPRITDAMFACFEKGYNTQVCECQGFVEAKVSEEMEMALHGALSFVAEAEFEDRENAVQHQAREFLHRLLTIRMKYRNDEDTRGYFFTRERIDDAVTSFEDELLQKLEDEEIEMPLNDL